jgi:hypothetical protein
MSKLSDYLKKYKIDARRLLPASKQLERMRPEDRIVRLARDQAKAGNEKAKEMAAKPRRSGRPLSAPLLHRALEGKPIPRRARGRVVRAVNAVLAHKTKTEAKPTDLF